jgi:hypothetical protein
VLCDGFADDDDYVVVFDDFWDCGCVVLEEGEPVIVGSRWQWWILVLFWGYSDVGVLLDQLRWF